MFSTRRLICTVGLMSAALGIAGCGKKKSTTETELAEGAAITIAGKLALENSSTAASLNLDGLNATSDVALADLKVYCVSFSFPPKAGTGTVDAEGNFSLSIEANGVAVGCFVLKGTETVASMTFDDTEAKSVDGGTKSDSRMAFSGNTNVGQIKLDTATGKAKADVKNFRNAVKNFAGAGFDFTGTWTIKPATNLPDGYDTACAQNTANCEGPTDGEKVFFKRITGKKDGKDVHLASIWKSEQAFTACGSKLGVSYADAKTATGIDFTASGVAEGAFTWSSDWVDGWKSSDAKTVRNMRECGPSTLNGVGVMRCKALDGTTPFWEVNLNTRDSGCKLSDGSPVKIDDWGQVTFGTGDCNTAFDRIPALKVCQNTATYKGQTLTCKNVGGAMNESMTAAYSPTGTISRQEIISGTSCSTLTGMQQLQCYADYYHKNGESNDGSKCIRDIQLNWGAENAAGFVMRNNGPTRARSQHLLSLALYTGENTVAVRDEKEYFRGFPTKDKDGRESFVNCKIIESINISMTKVAENEILFEMIPSARSVDMNPLCSAQTGGERGMTQKMMFKATR